MSNQLRPAIPKKRRNVTVNIVDAVTDRSFLREMKYIGTAVKDIQAV